ncbi:unnamed protein product [Adineta ricciae]|uniref:Uncharacterized protein n=1 Tax=Adineta ricciae TaxID=249248 RepID=A0A814RRC7_ADIRI|nr:unnamed protein product [Adineta ricciae]
MCKCPPIIIAHLRPFGYTNPCTVMGLSSIKRRMKVWIRICVFLLPTYLFFKTQTQVIRTNTEQISIQRAVVNKFLLFDRTNSQKLSIRKHFTNQRIKHHTPYMNIQGIVNFVEEKIAHRFTYRLALSETAILHSYRLQTII